MKAKEKQEKQPKTLFDYFDGVADTWFEYLMLIVIGINIISLGLETTEFGKNYANILFIVDQVCLWIFVVELIVRFIVYKKYGQKFFKNGWNIFDFVIIVVSFLSTHPFFTIFRVFKIFRSIKIITAAKSIRAVKAMKFVKSLMHLQRLMRAIILSFKGIMWTLFLLFIVYYVYAIIGAHLFGEEYPVFFGDLGNSLLSLFQIMTFDSWCSQIARPIIQAHGWAWIYFVTYALISAFVIMNVIVGIVVDSINQERQEYLSKDEGKKNVTIDELYKQIIVLQNQITEMKTENNISEKVERVEK